MCSIMEAGAHHLQRHTLMQSGGRWIAIHGWGHVEYWEHTWISGGWCLVGEGLFEGGDHEPISSMWLIIDIHLLFAVSPCPFSVPRCSQLIQLCQFPQCSGWGKPRVGLLCRIPQVQVSRTCPMLSVSLVGESGSFLAQNCAS